jgi:hypothetical protein
MGEQLLDIPEAEEFPRSPPLVRMHHNILVGSGHKRSS